MVEALRDVGAGRVSMSGLFRSRKQQTTALVAARLATDWGTQCTIV